MKKICFLFAMILTLSSLIACSHSDDDIKNQTSERIVVYYNDVDLNWNSNTFSHGDYTINIPDKWGWGIEGKREKFVEYDPHDIEFVYTLITKTTYGGDVLFETNFDELVYKKPTELNSIFEISTIDIDIDSKLFIKDELVNDCYFKYDSNLEYYNYCYFKISKNDITQLKSGSFNQINVKLKYYKHIDSSYSFMIDEEKDGLNNIGFYSDVSISYNPDLIK